MDKIPFTDYDFWGYLAAGFLLLAVLDYVAGTGLLMRETWTVVQSVIAVSAAYAIGHLIAEAASILFERYLVGRFLGNPRDVLFDGPAVSVSPWVRKCLPTYFQQLPKGTRNAALEKAKKKHTDPLPSHDDVFWAAFEHARQTEAVMNRVTTFLNLYGFCRNTALVAFINAAVLIGWALGNAPAHTLYWGLVALVLGIGMLFRYLKFFRLYAVELFTAFAHSK